VAFRRLSADQWFVGSQVRESAAPSGQPLFLYINSLDATFTYGVTDRVSVTLTVPFSLGTHSRFYADGKRYTVEAAGLGDISGVANVWLRHSSSESSGNVALGFGLKTASGNNGVVDDFFPADGSVTKKPRGSVDPVGGRRLRRHFPDSGVPQARGCRIRLCTS
jgi:hypothetical protein